MQIQEIMTQNPESVAPNDPLCVAAEKMSHLNCGVIPVVEDGKVCGIITDRDIVVRAVAKHKDPERSLIKDFMSNSVASCSIESRVPSRLQKLWRNDKSADYLSSIKTKN